MRCPRIRSTPVAMMLVAAIEFLMIGEREREALRKTEAE